MEQEHMEDDSVKLLRECNAGIKMGTSSIEDVLEHVQSGGSYYRWVQYGNQIPLPLPEPVPGSRQRDRSFD